MADRVQLITPTAQNLLRAVNEMLRTQRRLGSGAAGAYIPSQRTRALFIVHELSVLPVQTEE